MYEQISHSLLNSILDDLRPEIRRQNLRHFYTRLGANFYAIHSLFSTLYGEREDFQAQMVRLVETMAEGYIYRSEESERLDMRREQDHNWFLSQKWVGMALYTNGFADNLADLDNKIGYFQELGINMVHIMPRQVTLIIKATISPLKTVRYPMYSSRGCRKYFQKPILEILPGIRRWGAG